MKNIVVKVTNEKNWAGNEYLMYSTEEHGKIAEMDYPNDYTKKFRVWTIKGEADNNGVNMSCLSEGLVGAETVAKDYLYGLGYDIVVFNYPKKIRAK